MPLDNGATFYKMVHKFQLPGKNGEEGDYFRTEDRALSTPTEEPGVFMIDDRMKIVGGTGIFKNARGVIWTHGPLNANPRSAGCELGSLELDLRGRIFIRR